jgi:hypothetical protein
VKITFIGHASLLVEAGGVTILSDPWWRGPCFGAQWWNYPPPAVEALSERHVDFIYISHGHHDHLHPSTLRTLARDAKVLVSEDIGLADSIRDLGFSVTALRDGEEHSLGRNVKCRIMQTHGQDTLMAISDGAETCVNLNDALHSAPKAVQQRFIARLRALYPEIDYLFCGYGVASHFPNCYFIPGKNRELTAARRQEHFNRQWSRIMHGLAPRHGFPFAADVVFFEEDLQWANEPVHNLERPHATFARLYSGSRIQLHDIAPGFSIDSGIVVNDRRRGRISLEAAKSECRDAVVRSNSYGTVTYDAVTEIRERLESNISACREYLESFRGEYRFLIRFRNGPAAVEVTKRAAAVMTRLRAEGELDESAYDVTYTTRLAYLRQSLTTEFGHEVLFVGSGGVFRYRDPAKVRSNLHRELMFMLRHQPRALPPRSGGVRAAAGSVKRLMRRALGQGGQDLYDLQRWTVFGARGSQ